MTNPVFYHKGGEDSEWAFTGSGSIITTAGQFRANIARCAFSVGVNGDFAGVMNRVAFTGPPTSFWTTMRGYSGSSTSQSGGPNTFVVRFRGATGAIKLRFRTTSGATNSPTTIIAEKLTNSGTVTQLGSSSFPLSSPGTAGFKIDIFCNYNTSGSLQFYLNGALQFSFSGDVTTDGDTTLSYVEWGWSWFNIANNWSEGITSDTDTRTWGLITQQPVANGNTHNFDTGSPAAANVNATTTTFLTMDGSTTAGQIDQYTCPANPSGVFGIVCYSVSALLQKGTSGPTKADLGVRTGGSDFWSSDFVLTTSFVDYQNDWFTNPNTGNPWQTSEIGNASGFNIGVKSVT